MIMAAWFAALIAEFGRSWDQGGALRAAEDSGDRVKPDVVPGASFPWGRQRAGAGPAALEERWVT